MNWYYAVGLGRFLSADPYQASGGPDDPGSWNRYRYANGDPITGNDPMGLMTEISGSGGGPGSGGYAGEGMFGGGFAGECQGSMPTDGASSIGGIVGFATPWNPANLCSIGMSMFFAPGPAPGGGSGATQNSQQPAKAAPSNGPSYTRADICAASTLLNKGGATFLDALGMIPGEGSLLAGIQVAAALLSTGMTIFGESSPTDAAFAGVGLGLSAADLSKTATVTAKVLGKSLRVIPVAGNVLSGIATYRDIFGKDGMGAYYSACMAGKN